MKPHEPMLRYIRKNVEKPDHLPYLVSGALRFVCGKCPMGLLPIAVQKIPIDPKDFNYQLPPSFTFRDIRHFYEWWDIQEDPKRAVEAVWGKE